MQLVQAAAPIVDVWPAAHFPHVVDEVAPTSAPYVPAAQLVQLADPMLTAYKPGQQRTQLESAKPAYWPAMHGVHTGLAVWPPVFEKVPAAQPVQAALPEVGPYLPAPHQLQSIAPAPEYLPATQISHTVLLVAPVSLA